jgi:hypothetical protein
MGTSSLTDVDNHAADGTSSFTDVNNRAAASTSALAASEKKIVSESSPPSIAASIASARAAGCRLQVFQCFEAVSHRQGRN